MAAVHKINSLKNIVFLALGKCQILIKNVRKQGEISHLVLGVSATEITKVTQNNTDTESMYLLSLTFNWKKKLSIIVTKA